MPRPTPSTTPASERAWILAVLLAGLAIRVLVLLNTAGTSDARRWEQFAQILRDNTIADSYSRHTLLNHPPPALALLRSMDRAAQASGAELGTIMRASQIAADVLLYLVLAYFFYSDSRRLSNASIYFLSPVVILVSSHHVNTDSLLMLFLIAGVALLVRERYVWAGVAIGCACAIKVLPLILLPIVVVCLKPRASLKFGVGLAAILIPAFGPLAWTSMDALIRSILGYGGGGPRWALSLVLTLAGRVVSAASSLRVAPASLNTRFFAAAATVSSIKLLFTALSVSAATAVAYRRSRVHGPDSIALVAGLLACFALVIATAPNVGVHYLIWALPFLPFVMSKRETMAVHAGLSGYLIAFYAITSRAHAPFYSDLTHKTYSPLMTYSIELIALPAWLITLWIAYKAIRFMTDGIRPAESSGRPSPAGPS